MSGKNCSLRFGHSAVVAVAIVGLSALFASCVPFVTAKKGNAPSKEASQGRPRLIKPTISGGTGPVAASGKTTIGEDIRGSVDGKGTFPAGSTQVETTRSSESKRVQPGTATDLRTPAAKSSRPPRSGKRTAGNGISSRKTSSHSKSAPARGTKGKSEPSTQNDAIPAADTDLKFEKPDHAKYVNKIRNKAIDKVNRERLCQLARLCNDSITEEWLLTLYFTEAKTYVFRAYVWDAIDGKWREAFASTKEPLSTLQRHLKISAGGKKCTVLKNIIK